MHLYSYSCISIHIHVFILIFMCLYSYSSFIFISIYLYLYSCIYIHIHVFIFIIIFLYSYSSIYIHIHLFIFTFLYLYSHLCYIVYIQVFIFTFMLHFHIHSYVCMVLFIHMHGYFHGTRECECITSEVHIHVQPTKTIPCEFNNSRQCILVWSSCLDQPRVHLKFPDDVMPSITRTLAIILHCQINGSVGAAECRLLCTRKITGSGLPLRMFSCNFFCCLIFLSFVCQYSYPSKR